MESYPPAERPTWRLKGSRSPWDFLWRAGRVEHVGLVAYLFMALAWSTMSPAGFQASRLQGALLLLLPYLVHRAWRQALAWRSWERAGRLELEVGPEGLRLATHLLPWGPWQRAARRQGGQLLLPWSHLEAAHVSDQLLRLRPGETPGAGWTGMLKLGEADRTLWTYLQLNQLGLEAHGHGGLGMIEVRELVGHQLPFWEALARHQPVAFWKGCVPTALAHLSRQGHAILDLRAQAAAPGSPQTAPPRRGTGALRQAKPGAEPAPPVGPPPAGDAPAGAPPQGEGSAPLPPGPARARPQRGTGRLWAARGLRGPWGAWKERGGEAAATLIVGWCFHLMLAEHVGGQLPGGLLPWVALPCLALAGQRLRLGQLEGAMYRQHQQLDLAIEPGGLRVAGHMIPNPRPWQGALEEGQGLIFLPWGQLEAASLAEPPGGPSEGASGQNQWRLELRLREGGPPDRALQLELSALGEGFPAFLQALARHLRVERGPGLPPLGPELPSPSPSEGPTP